MSQAVSRRGFLKGLLGIAGGALALSVPLAGCAPRSYPHAAGRAFFTDKEWAVLDAAARRLVPGGPARPNGGEVSVADRADALFAKGNLRLKADLKQLLNTFEDHTWLAGRLKPFTAMSPAEQDTYLSNWMGSGLGVKRQAFVALNRASQMLYYMDERAWPAIGYPGPWIGRLDVGLGLDNQGVMAANPNPNVFKTFPAAKGA